MQSSFVEVCVGRQRRLCVSTFSGAVVGSGAQALRRRQLNSSSVADGFMSAPVVKRRNQS
jgi:hypothetical protein